MIHSQQYEGAEKREWEIRYLRMAYIKSPNDNIYSHKKKTLNEKKKLKRGGGRRGSKGALRTSSSSPVVRDVFSFTRATVILLLANPNKYKGYLSDNFIETNTLT